MIDDAVLAPCRRAPARLPGRPLLLVVALGLASLLRSDRAPDWVVLTQPGLRTWGIEAAGGQAALSAGYRLAARVGTDTVYRRAPAGAARSGGA